MLEILQKLKLIIIQITNNVWMEKEKEGMKKEEIHQNPGSMNTKNTTCYNSIRLEST